MLLIAQAAASIFLASSLVAAQTVPIGQACNPARNRLAYTTHQFLSDCIPSAYCDTTTSICKPRGCRVDQFPFKFPVDDPSNPLPPLCPEGQFCPDEGDQCLPQVPVGQNCQIDRDDECQPAPNPPSVQTPWNTKGAICLRFTCFWQNVTLGQPCVFDNVMYTGYRANGSEFGTIMSRDNCQAPLLYCDAQGGSVCKQALDLGVSCGSDKECISRNCGLDNTCHLPAGTVAQIPLWEYVLTGVGIVAVVAIILTSLFISHKRQRAKTQREIREYFHEQTTYRSSIIALHTAARDRTSIYSRSESRFSQYDEHGQMIYRDDDSQRQLMDNRRHSRLRNSVAAEDDESSDEETAQAKRLLSGEGPSGMVSRESFNQSRYSFGGDDTPRGSFDYGQAGTSGSGYAAVPVRQSMDVPKGGNFKDPWNQ